MTITEFLLARIAEDEAEVGELGPCEHDDSAGPNGVGWADVGAISDVLMVSHARMRAECKAKRRIVELHSVASTYQGGTYCAECQSEELEGPWSRRDDLYPCSTLEALASVYADHSDYRDEWRI